MKGREKMRDNKSKFAIILAVILFVCAAASSMAVLSIMNPFLLSDEGAISIAGDEVSYAVTEEKKEESSSAPSEESAEEAEEGKSPSQSKNTSSASSGYPSFTPDPGFAVMDEHGVVWQTETEVEIFKVEYENGEGVVTVRSDNGDKLVAPGTENSYTFKLKNTGNVPIDYRLEVDAYITPGDYMIPIESRINRYDGKWIVGGKDVYVDVPTLDEAEDMARLGAGKYTYYTLDWRWPFESGNDEHDTFLGNLAAQEDITITIVLKTTAYASDDIYQDEGITPPDTGDDSILSLWIAIAVGCVVLIFILIAYLVRDKKRSEKRRPLN